MTKRIIAAILMLSLLLGCGAAAAEETAPMYELTAKYGFKLGAPLSFWNMQNQSYLTVIKSNSTASPPPTR